MKRGFVSVQILALLVTVAVLLVLGIGYMIVRQWWQVPMNLHVLAEQYCGQVYGGEDYESQPIVSAYACGNRLRLVRGCCDAPDVVLDWKGKFIGECGGEPGGLPNCDKLIPELGSCSKRNFCQPGTTAVSSTLSTANWRTYRNEQYGFEVKYPAEWLAQEGPKTIVSFIAPYQSMMLGGGIDVSFYGSSLPGVLQPESSFAGKKAFVTEWRPIVPSGFEKKIYIIENPKFFLAAKVGSEDSQGATKILEDQILSTFKFIPPPSNLSVDSSSQVQVTAPAAGEVWQLSTTHSIRWVPPPSPLGKAFETVIIALAPPRPACLDATPRCMIVEISPYIIADGVIDNGSYDWKIPAGLSSPYVGGEQVTITIK